MKTVLTVLIVIPVYNEESLIYGSINKLRDFCEKNLQNYDWKIIIDDNNSTDRTAEIAKNLENESNGKIIYKFIPQKAKVWLSEKAGKVLTPIFIFLWMPIWPPICPPCPFS